MNTVEVDGLNVAYERVGEGTPLVLLHGYVGDGLATWRQQIEDLSSDFSVVAWDAPGAGKSADPPETFGIAGYSDCLARFIGELGLGSAHVIGLSFGGALVLEFQHRHPELVRSLVLVSAYAGWRGSLPAEAAEDRLAQALRLSTRSRRDFVDALLPTMFALPVAPEDLEMFRAAMEEFHPRGFRAMARASAEDVSAVLTGVSVPTLLVYGNNDQRAPLPVAEHIHGAITGSRLVILEGAGHLCNVELPQQFNAAVRGFLSEREG